MTKFLFTARAKLNGNVSRETIGGKEIAIVPAAIIVEGVMNGNLVTMSEVSKVNWDGIPITLDHPSKGGDFISAANPETQAESPGVFTNSKVIGKKLTGVFHFDVEKTQTLGGVALEALEAFEAGQTVEVSSAFFMDFDDKPGNYLGQPFEGKVSNLKPDHVAILLNDIGACSVADGCGAGEKVVINKESRMNRLIQAFKNTLSEQDNLVWNAFHEEFGFESFTMMPIIFSENVISRKGGEFVQSTYTVSEDGSIKFGKLVNVEITTKSKSKPEANNEQSILSAKFDEMYKLLRSLLPNKEGSMTEKEKLVETILSVEGQALEPDTLNLMGTSQLKVYSESLVKPVVISVDPIKVTEPNDETPPAWASKLISKVDALTANANQSANQRKAELITRIMTNSLYADKEEMLKQQSLDELNLLAQAVATPLLSSNYAMQAAGPQYNTQDEYEELAHPGAKKEAE